MKYKIKLLKHFAMIKYVKNVLRNYKKKIKKICVQYVIMKIGIINNLIYL